ncbi:MAG: hypothetical protein JWM35_660 [Verrucomicrobia bacterium]|nr:hypothetical protein [Verrucomicrobiota bacterium]
METEPNSPNAPAVLMRRMSRVEIPAVVRLACDSTAPILRFSLESQKGGIVAELADVPSDARGIQWTQNGIPIDGQTGEQLRLSELLSDDSDVYFAVISTAGGTQKSQAFQVIVKSGNPLLNFSARGRVTETNFLFAGFVVGRPNEVSSDKRYLIRGIGQSLRKFGVETAVTKPRVSLFRRGRKLVPLQAESCVAPAIVDASQRVGAAAVDELAGEFVAIATLPPGPYSIVAQGGPEESGEILVEIYEIP